MELSDLVGKVSSRDNAIEDFLHYYSGTIVTINGDPNHIQGLSDRGVAILGAKLEEQPDKKDPMWVPHSIRLKDVKSFKYGFPETGYFKVRGRRGVFFIERNLQRQYKRSYRSNNVFIYHYQSLPSRGGIERVERVRDVADSGIVKALFIDNRGYKTTKAALNLLNKYNNNGYAINKHLALHGIEDKIFLSYRGNLVGKLNKADSVIEIASPAEYVRNLIDHPTRVVHIDEIK